MNWLTWIIEALKKFKICRVGWQAKDPGEPMLQFPSEGWQTGDPVEAMFQFVSEGCQVCCKNPEELMLLIKFKKVFWRILFCSEEFSLFGLFKHSVDWMRITDIIEGSLLYSEYTN